NMEHGADQIGVIASPTSTTEELYLLQKMMRKLGINNIDSRLTQSDFALDNETHGVHYLGAGLAEFLSSKSILVLGSILRGEQPLLAAKLRTATKNGVELNIINTVKENLLCNVANELVCDPRDFAYILAQLVKATGGAGDEIDLSNIEVTGTTIQIANSIKNNGYIILGEVAKMQPNYSELVILVQKLAQNIHGKFGFLPAFANEVGAQLVGCVPNKGQFNQKIANVGKNVKQMLENQFRAYFVLNTELECDAYDTRLALNALTKADTVIMLSSYTSEHMKHYADVILPVTPFTETAGSYVNLTGVWQKFNAVAKPLGDAKPAWKVLRVLANTFQVDGFDYESIADIRAELEPLNGCTNYLNNTVTTRQLTIKKPLLNDLIRVGLQNMYGRDSITRRASSLQLTKQALMPSLVLSKQLAESYKIENLSIVQVKQLGYMRSFNVVVDETLPSSVVMLSVNDDTCGFAGRFDTIAVQTT
ncbi:MAG: molybdopterin-dependent oxidoreductase, partial [Burkholderiales bacterium]|nr:molybdopterin-dependent oxidoreductase [Burkholderiales bacterium]